MGWYITEQLHILNTEHYLDNKMLSLQPVERIAFILRNKFKFAMQAWQIYYIQTHRMYLSIRHTHTPPPPSTYITELQLFYGFLSSINETKLLHQAPQLQTL